MMLGIVTAAVVGVILNLTIYLGKAVIFPGGISFASADFFAITWVAVSFLCLYRFKVSLTKWIGVSAVAGLLHFLFNSYTR